MIKPVWFYKIICDDPGCGADSTEDGEFAAYDAPSSAVADAIEGEWYVSTLTGGPHYCPDHRPPCAPGCGGDLDGRVGPLCPVCHDDAAKRGTPW